MMATIKSTLDGINGKAVEMLRSAARFIDENAEQLVGELEKTPVLENGLNFYIELRPDELPIVTAQKSYIVLPKTQK